LSEDLIRPNPPGFVVEPDDLHVARLFTAEERINVILPLDGMKPYNGFANALDADGLPAVACPLSDVDAAIGAIYFLRHAGTYILNVAIACTVLPTGNLINTSLKGGFSNFGVVETIVGPNIATFLNNITVVKAPYLRQHPVQLVIPNDNSLLRVTLSKRDSSNGAGSLAVLAMVVVKMA